MPTTNYVWDADNDSYLMETDGTDSTTAVYTNEPTEFGQVVSERRGATDNWYHFDAIGSTRDVTDSSQTETDSFVYSAFGVTVVRSGTTPLVFRFVGQTGYCFDEELDEYYVRRRSYRPAVSRWTSADPLGVARWARLYGYTENSPQSSIDPSGLLSWRTIRGPLNLCCGKYEWGVRFIPERPGQEQGWIVQKVRFDYRIFDCDCEDPQEVGHSKECTRRNNSNAPYAPFEYFEIWAVEGGHVYGLFDLKKVGDCYKLGKNKKADARDLFFWREPGEGTRTSGLSGKNCCDEKVHGGFFYQEGEVTFYPGDCAPSGYWPKSGEAGHVEEAGNIRSRCAAPANWPGTELYRGVSRRWNCCSKETRFDRLLTVAIPEAPPHDSPRIRERSDCV